MRINFDEIGLTLASKRASVNQSPIKIQIQSPIYNQVIRQLSPHNYRAEINSMNSVISLPPQISQFIAEQIQKQLQQNDESNIQSQSYFFSKTKSQINIIKDLKSTQSTTIIKQALNTTKKVNKNTNKKTNKNKTHISYKKHSCNDHISTQARNTLKQCEQLTYVPRLYPNELNQKIDFNRKVHAYVTNSNKNSNVYDSLYQQAATRRMKTQMQKQLNEVSKPQRKPKINNNFYSKNNKTYTPLHNRLNQILYRRVDRIKQLQSLDITTGRELFKPDLNNSKDSYKIYLKSLSKEKIQTKMRKKQSTQLNQIKQQTKKLNHVKTLKQQLLQSRVKQCPIDVKTIEYFTQIFYPNNFNSSPATTITQANSIKKPQFMVLHAFLHQIQQLQSKRYEQQTTVSSSRMGMSTPTSNIEGVLSRQDFKQKLKKYYQGLNLHDRQILRSQIWKNNRKKHRQKDQQSHINIATHRPLINIRSASLDNLANGHTHKIYYV